MQLLGNLFEYVLAKRGQQINILGATSGDTGSVRIRHARQGWCTRVFMLSPYGKMSSFQRAQMYSLQDANIFNIAVRGMFDDAQDIVKAFPTMRSSRRSTRLVLLTPINWARVIFKLCITLQGLLCCDDEQ